MSVSDPLIKDIKACTLHFLEEAKQSGSVSDSGSNLINFCQCVEKILNYGLNVRPKSFGFIKHVDAWNWLEKTSSIRDSIITYAYNNSVENVQKCPNVHTNSGKIRLLIRFCLVGKCLYVPIQYLIQTKKINTLYKENSIIGDEILSEIFLSVLLQCSKIKFALDLQNSSFFDYSWHLPQMLKLELVPCKNLGLSVSFSGDKAVIINLKSNSVISENDNIEVGDILDNLNGVHICSATKGRLNSILQSNKGCPITVTIIKAINSSTGEIYLPAVKFLKDVCLDPLALKNKSADKNSSKVNVKKNQPKNTSAGFKVTYLGNVNVGKYGDVKQIDKSVRIILSPYHHCSESKFLRTKQVIFFEIGEIGVKIVDFESSEVVYKHSYMEISSCGSVSYMPNYFAYIVGDEYCNVASNFTCHVFHCNNTDNVFTILQSLGQGFQRTHFAV